ncbi:hypothetical protein FA15DRAFT_755465 [Coprinopsis marcescibilis]|uniref:TPR-like protein n=1 Tax=Coprinopsis marcescibilis TaxID=230819 RepID=A0A5C3L191_COPMA|nr:hypothetical protein FA15DRAFT_755465 [Coprinopsis marcescibilis]
MSSAKERHYWSQLRSVLTAGQWLAQFPAKAPNSVQLSWAELFRKFNKHCKNANDVAEIASQNYALALLLAASSLNEDEDYGDVRDFTVELGNECLLPAERVEEATAGYNALKALESSDSDSLNSALAYYAYALGNPTECLAHLSSRQLDFSRIQSQGSTRSTTSNLLAVPTNGAPSASSSVTGGFSLFADPSVPQVQDGRGWALTETFRSLCLQGMCKEKLYPDEPLQALKAYRAAFPAFRTLTSQDFASLTTSPSKMANGKLDFTTFIQFRELWRWVERLLWRAICLASRVSDVHAAQDEDDEQNSLWVWLEKYTICSSSWPPTFRAEHRSTVSSIYLRALVLRHAEPVAASGGSAYPVKSPMWLHTARSVINDYRAILAISTKFPRAGQRNVKVEELADLCVAVWEASGAVGESSNWVLDILWWATRLTFNSSRVIRHMIRLFYLSGDHNLAKRSLRLYVQVVSKAWQASKQGAGESVDPDDNDSQLGENIQGYLEDTDTDENWVSILVYGARMLCRMAAAQPGRQNIDDAKEAKKMLAKAKERMSVEDNEENENWRRLRAEIALAEGVCEGILAIKGEDPHSRPDLLNKAHVHLLQSIALFPTPDAHFHIAISLSRYGPDRDLEQAIKHAGLAVEGKPHDRRYWHLLGLLLTAAEKWSEAAAVLEHGAELDGNHQGHEINDETPGDETIQGENTRDHTPDARDGATPRPTPDKAEGGSGFALQIELHGSSMLVERVGAIPTLVLAEDATFVPPAASLLGKILDIQHPPSTAEVFEQGLQLRMTQMALMEVRQGAEGAEQGWLDVYAWVAEKRGVAPAPLTESSGEAHPRQSFDGRHSMMHMSQISVTALNATTVKSVEEVGQVEQEVARLDVTEVTEVTRSYSVSSSNLPQPAIPITISPASPDIEHPNPNDGVFQDSDRRSEDERKGGLIARKRRSSSSERGDKEKDKGGDTSTSKKVQQMLKSQVHKGQMRISAVGKRLGHGVGVAKSGGLRRSNSAPDFHAVLQQTSYQASSIHSRKRLSSIIHSHSGTPTESQTPPPPTMPLAPGPNNTISTNNASARETRLLSDLWLMSAATFRRLSKIEQAKGAIQEAEVRDENNTAVWVQLALYYIALNHTQHAISTLQKALFIDPDDVPATVHLGSLYITPPAQNSTYFGPPGQAHGGATASGNGLTAQHADVDLACGLLTQSSKGRGWNVPEVWYYLAKAYRAQNRRDKEGEALQRALVLAESRGVREISAAIGLCI